MTKWKPEDIKIYKVWLKYRKRKEDDYEKERGRERVKEKKRERKKWSRKQVLSRYEFRGTAFQVKCLWKIDLITVENSEIDSYSSASWLLTKAPRK